MNKYSRWAVGVAVVLALGIIWYLGFKRPANINGIDSYAECIKYFPQQTLMYPPNCRTPDGRVFIDPTATEVVSPTGTVGMANPASVYCVQQGGTLKFIEEEPSDAPGGGGGQVGMCLLPNGNECEEWSFYRGECQ